MALGTLKQEELNPQEPPDWAGLEVVTCTLTFEPKPAGTTANAILAFSYKEIVSTPIGPGPTSPRLNIDVKKDVVIEISLDPAKKWRWSTRLQAITTKQSFQIHYGQLRYWQNGMWRAEPDEQPACMKIKFLAALNEGGSASVNHGFSMNIELLQPDNQWLPITLDPDIKNPPEDPDESLGSPFLSAA